MASFFFFNGRDAEEPEIVDQVAHRYGWTIREIMDLDAGMLFRLYRRILTEDTKRKAWDLYCEHFRYMITGQLQYKSFDDYYDRFSGQDIDLRPAEEILAEVAEIEKQFNEGGVAS